MATTIFQDHFTEPSADTDLNSHTPDTGTGWTKVWGTGSSSKLQAKATPDDLETGGSVANSGAIYSADASYPDADYAAEVKIVSGFTGTNRGYLIVRLQDQENMYALRFSTGATATRLYKKVSGTWTALGSFVADPAAGDTVRVEVVGPTLRFFYNGVVKGFQVDTAITAAGKAGLAIGGGAELAASTDDITSQIFDDFLVQTIDNPLAETEFSTSVTSMPVNLPTSQDGDMLIAIVEDRNAAAYTPPSGWTELIAQAGGGSVGKMVVFYKKVGASEGLQVTFTAGTSTTAIWQVIRFRNWHGTTAPEAASASGDSTNADPPNLTPSWGGEPTIWLAIAGHAAASAAAFSAGPSGYSGFRLNGASSGGSACSVASAYKQASAASENPGAFTPSGSNRWWTAVTLALRPPNTTPTIAPNTADAHDFGTDTTPTLEATGTDAEANDLRYEFQIATDNLFSNGDITKKSMASMAQRLSGGDPTVSTVVTDENCLIAVVTSQDSNTNNLGAESVTRDGQSFTKIAEYGGSGGTGQPCNIQIWRLNNPNAGTANTVADCNGLINECTMTVYRLKDADVSGDPIDNYNGGSGNGTPPSADVTTGTDNCYLIAGLVSEGAISGVGAGQDDDASLTDQSFENTRCTSKQGGAAGAQSLTFSGASQPYAYMIVAVKKGGTPSVILDKVSGTDSGFANTVTGGDTDPFNSGEKVGFTVQAGDALATGTYYWRARVKDPSGTNTYSAWTTARSFIVSSATPHSLTKSTQYAIKYTPTAKTKSLKYCVKVTPTAPSKSLSYRVKTTTAPTKFLKYTVTKANSTTKSLKYCVKITPAAKTKGLIYQIVQAFSKTKSAQYAVKTSQSKTKAQQYAVKTSQQKTKSLQYGITTQASKTKGLVYAVKKAIALTKALTYEITTPTAITKSTRYAITTPGQKTKSTQYAITTQQVKTKGLTYEIEGTAAHSIERALAYAIQTQHSLEKALAYSIVKPGTIAKSLQYEIKQAEQIAKTLAYALQTTQAKTKSLTYAIAQEEALTKSLTYSVKLTNLLQKAERYAIRTTAQKTKVLTYAIEETGSLQKPLKYAVKTTAQKSLAQAYALKTTASIQKALAYSIATDEALQKTLTYLIKAEKVKTKSLKYVVRVYPYTDKTSPHTRKATPYTEKTNPFVRAANPSSEKTSPYERLRKVL